MVAIVGNFVIEDEKIVQLNNSYEDIYTYNSI